MYRIGLIKRPGVYFLAHLSEGAFKRDGRLFKHGRLLFKIITCRGVYLIKHMHTHMAHVHRARSFIATPISMSVYLDMGVYFLRCSYRMGVYSGMGVYSSRAFNQANTVYCPKRAFIKSPNFHQD